MKKTMLRLITARKLSAIFKTSAVLQVSKCQVNRISLPLCATGVPKVHFCTESPYRKDVPLPNPQVSDDGPDTIDLDKWKAVMKLKAVPEENIRADDADDENDEDTQDNLTLEVTRELVTMWRLAGKQMPEKISEDQLQSLANFTTKNAKKKYLKYLAIKERHKMLDKLKREKRKAEKEQRAELERQDGADDNDDRVKNSLFLMFWNRSLDKLLFWRCAQAMRFDQPLVFDMSYEGNMTKRDLENTVTQLMEVESWNRRASEPYHLHYCNLQPDSGYEQQLIKRYGAEAWDRLLITSTDKQHFEVFPREQLVYLTADSPNVLRRYDHSKVYIIGGLVDRAIQPGLSLANAKRLKLATARLPLNEYLRWDMGAKNLTLDQMMRILLTLKETGKWEEALKFVPIRKHVGFQSYQQKETVTNKHEKTFNLNNTRIRPTFDRPQTLKTTAGKSNRATANRNWWNEE